jgi:ribosomal-protein-alanine N-acetyltransferase
MANYRPENTRSAGLPQRPGFEHEGRARAYLKIDGSWADHVLTSLPNPQDVE